MEGLPRLSLAHPGTTLIVLAVITVILGSQVPNSKPEFGYRVLVGDDHPAMRGAVLHCGRAIITSSMALSLGFLTLAGSAWQSISSFGLFIALGILGAVIASLLVLPAGIVELEMRRSWRLSNSARLGSSPARL